MKERLKLTGLAVMFIGMLFLCACLNPVEDSFDQSNSSYKTLVINEIVARAADGGADWIELYNASGYDVYLRDYALVDDNTEREPISLPDMSLGPGGFFVIQTTNEAPEDGSFYVPFGLGTSDSIILFWGLTVVDKLGWETDDAPSGYSYGRFPDGTGAACTLIPTRSGKNKEYTKSSLVINEIVATPSDSGIDWIELYNTGEDPVYLENYSIVDDNAAHEPVSLPNITLGPGEFFVMQATGTAPTNGSFYMPFGLGPGDSVTLYKGADIMDVLDWEEGDAPEGYSFGRLPDGTVSCKTLVPSQGEANQGVELFQKEPGDGGAAGAEQ